MANEGNQDSLRQRVVDATIQLHGGIDATHLVRTKDLIQLRQVLRELCALRLDPGAVPWSRSSRLTLPRCASSIGWTLSRNGTRAMDAVRDLTRHHAPTRLDVLLPESRLERPPLLPKDFEDLAFVAEHADMVGLSFAESPAGIEALADALRVRTSRPIEAGTTVQLFQAARLSNFLAPRRYGALAGNDGR